MIVLQVIQLEGELAALGASVPVSGAVTVTSHSDSRAPPAAPPPCDEELTLSDTDAPNTGGALRSSTESLDDCVPPHALLDVSAGKAKAELANKGGLAKRNLPSGVRRASMVSVQ